MKDGKLLSGDIRIASKKILDVNENLTSNRDDQVIRFDNHYLYRGLINAHDHLEMNLYPRMGTPPYNNYTEWARDVYKPQDSPVKEIESVPIRHRLVWGGIKNLISGVTTVVHHNPWYYSMDFNFPVRVLKKYQWAHSLAFEKNLKKKLRKETPFIIHAAEGVDAFARNEIDQLDKLGLLNANSVLVHGVAIGKNEIEKISRANASLVWCPSSNLFMFRKTADVPEIEKKISVALGSDSTMTGCATFLDEMKAAHQSEMATAGKIFEMASVIPERIFNLPSQQISPGFPADLLIMPIKTQDYYDNLILQDSADISAVIINGKLQYADPIVADGLNSKGFPHKVGNADKWFAYDIARLKEKILSKGMPESLIQKNELWQLLN